MNLSARPLLLHKYVLREFIPPFGVGLLVFTFVMTLHHLFLMMDLFLNRGVEILTILKMTGLILPMFLPLSIPMASLLAALVAYGRLCEDGELTALKSGGCSLLQYSLPNILLGVGFSVLLVFFNLVLAPRSTMEFKNIHQAVAQKNPLALFAPKIMNHFGEYKVIVDSIDRGRKRMEGVSIYKLNPAGAPTRILAPEGEIHVLPDGELTLELVNGALHQPNPNSDSEYTITKFNRFALLIPSQTDFDNQPATPREMNFTQLREKIREAVAQKISPAPWQTENHLRIAIAFAPVVFIVLGISLGILFRKGSRAVGMGISVVVILIYYGLFMFSVSLASQGLFSPMVLTWIPNLIALAVGLGVWRRLARQ